MAMVWGRRQPRRAAPARAALWRYAGALGKCWRLHALHPDVPEELQEKHVELMNGLKRLVMPHLDGGSEAGELLSFLQRVAKKPGPLHRASRFLWTFGRLLQLQMLMTMFACVFVQFLWFNGGGGMFARLFQVRGK